MIESLSIAVHAFVSRVSMSFSVVVNLLIFLVSIKTPRSEIVLVIMSSCVKVRKEFF